MKATLFKVVIMASVVLSTTMAKLSVLKPENLKNMFEEGRIKTVNSNFGYIPYG
jgi:hypothetical protein